MTELIIGARRPAKARRVARTAALAAAALAITAVVGWIAFRRATTYPVPRGAVPDAPLVASDGRLALGASSLERVGGSWVLRLEGDPYALGAIRGRLLGALATQGGVALDAAVVGEDPPSGGVGRLRHDSRLRWRYRLLADGLPDERRRELAGLAAGLRAGGVPGAPTYQKLVWRQAALDVGAAPSSPTPIGGVATGLIVASAPPSGGGGSGGSGGGAGGGVGGGQAAPAPAARVLVGRSFALPSAEPPPEVVVAFVRPEGAIPFAQVGWGGQVGVVTGVNAEGIAIAVNPGVAEDVRRTAAAEPVALVARGVLERARTLDEALAILKEARPLGAATFVVADGNARTFAVVERSPGRFVVLARGKSVAVAGDVLQAQEFARDAENDRARRLRGRTERLGRATALAQRPPADAPAVAALLRDRHAADGDELPPGHPGAIDDLGQQHVAIIDATSLVLWVGEGPGAGGRLRAFDLRAELRGEPPRLIDAMSIAPDATLDLELAGAAALARAEVRAAERLARRGRRRAAAEAAARAIALAPALPDGYRVAAELARADGDDERSRALERRAAELAGR